ncbi:MAG TPA: hypothetical protein VFO29_04605 [Candidatus Rubrimentiphilum sp.]|nr:hypothetical protein [Candidatus Rubrimentiphilum sp.]
MNTVDPAVINTRFDQFTRAITKLRANYERATPSEKRLFATYYAALEDGYAFWQAKKAHEDTGGMVDVPTASRYREFLLAALKGNDRLERSYAADTVQLDRQIQRCKATQGGGEARQRTNWSGTYVSGPYTIVVSGGFGSLSYKGDRNDPSTTDHVSGKCTVNGSEARCEETGTYHDSGKDVERTSTVVLTLSGDTILSRAKVTKASVTLASGQPCPDPAQCTSLHAGAEFDGTWTRKKP